MDPPNNNNDQEATANNNYKTNKRPIHFYFYPTWIGPSCDHMKIELFVMLPSSVHD